MFWMCAYLMVWEHDGRQTEILSLDFWKNTQDRKEEFVMKQWTADFVNDPYDDYNLIVEILYDDEEIAVIKRGQQGLEMKCYPNKEELTIPIDWLAGLFSEARKRMRE